MLMKTPQTLVYLSAEDLGITERERAGLIEVRDDLASGRVKHTPIKEDINWDDRVSGSLNFNMAQWSGKSECGTCFCIGGFLADRGVIDFIQEGSAPLQSLFYPQDHDGLSKLKPDQAVRAIDAFLSGAGPDCWPMALADVPPA